MLVWPHMIDTNVSGLLECNGGSELQCSEAEIRNISISRGPFFMKRDIVLFYQS